MSKLQDSITKQKTELERKLGERKKLFHTEIEALHNMLGSVKNYGMLKYKYKAKTIYDLGKEITDIIRLIELLDLVEYDSTLPPD